MKPQFKIMSKTTFTADEITAITALDALCKQTDGIDVRVGLDALAHRTGENVSDVLCYDGEQLIGYLNYFSFDDLVAEVNGMVHPQYRRQGVFSGMFAVAEQEMKQRGIGTAAFVVHLQSGTGQGFVQHIGATYRNAEYTMSLTALQPLPQRHAQLQVREATPDDFEFLVTCSSRAFGDPEDWTRNLLERTNEPVRTSYVALIDTVPVGMVRVFRFGEQGVSIHGFAVLPEHQGKGYGRQILSDTVQLMLEQGRTEIELDVETENENALGLYKSCGFAVESAYGFYLRAL